MRAHPVRARPWREGRPPVRVLAMRFHAFGDTVLTLPYLSALRRAVPGLELDFLTRREVGELPRALTLFDRVHEIGGGRDPRRQLLSALALVPRLRKRRYEIVLDLQRNRISRLVRSLIHPRAWSEFDRLSPRLAGERTRSTIEAVGLGVLRVVPDLSLRDPACGMRALRDGGWDGRSELVVLNPAGAFPGRRWPIASYERFAGLWLENVAPDARFVLLGLPSLAARTEPLKAGLGSPVIDLVGRTSGAEAFAILQRTRLVLSEDSGLMHLAWVAGAATFGLFGASRGAWARPHGSYADYVRACRLTDGACVRGECAHGSDSCLSRFTPEDAFQRSLALVRRAERDARVIVENGDAYAPDLDG